MIAGSMTPKQIGLTIMIDITMSALSFMMQILAGAFGPNHIAHASHAPIHEEVYCLALNAYHEARGVGMNEMLAVSQVVMNRVESAPQETTVCEVITEGPKRESWRTRKNKKLANHKRVYYPVRNKCQFSWYCDGKSDAVRGMKGWEDAVLAAYLVYHGYGEDRVYGAKYYYAHASIRKPVWAKSMKVTAVLRGHTYLK